jgi:predicted DsbA family dithiol-disulfide isomerase
VLRAAAVEAGLDAEEMQRRVEAGTYRATVDAQIGEAQALVLNQAAFFDSWFLVGG